MKKEFKAPIVEMKEFTNPEDIMVGVMLTSIGQNANVTSVTDDAAVDGFKIWKGFGE